MVDNEYYRDLEARLREIVPLAEALASPRALATVREYLDHGEYGLAVESLVEDVPWTPRTRASRELASRLLPEARLMGLERWCTELLESALASRPG